MSSSGKHFLSGLLDRVFSQKNDSDARSSKRRVADNLHRRHLSMELLEDRQLLAVSLAELNAVQNAFPAYDIPSTQGAVNTIEVTGEIINAKSFQEAFDRAAETPENDMIVIRAEKEDLNLDYTLDTFTVSGAYADSGATYIVGITASGEVYNPLEIVTRYAYSVDDGVVLNGDYFFGVTDPTVDYSEYLTANQVATDDLIGLSRLKADSRFADYDGEGYTVVILDSGIYSDHNFFKDEAGNSRIVYQYDYVYGDDTAEDLYGHGTHVASIAAGYDSTGNYSGIASGANIVALKVLGNDGSGNLALVTNAMNWVLENAEAYNIVSVNLSLGDHGNYRSIREVGSNYSSITESIQRVVDAGIIVSVASGNDYDDNGGKEGVAYPAILDSVLSVGAVYDGDYGTVGYDLTTTADQITCFTQRGEGLIDVMAPGAMITAAGNTSPAETATKMGTSMASPVVAGSAVLMQQIAQSKLGYTLTADEFKELLTMTSVSIYDGDNETSHLPVTDTWYNRIDVYAMADAIANGGEIPDDRFKGNDSWQTVARMEEGAENSANLGVLDKSTTMAGNVLELDELRLVTEEDWFRYTLTHTASSSDTITADFDVTNRSGAIKMYLYRDNGNGTITYLRDYDSVSSEIRAVNPDNKESTQVSYRETISLAGLEAGSYFIKIVMDPSATQTVCLDYTLTFKTGADDIYEMNNTWQTATDLGILEQHGIPYTLTNLMLMQADPDNTSEMDWYKFEMTGDGTEENQVSIFFQYTYEREGDGDLDIYLYRLDDVTGNLVLMGDSHKADSSSGVDTISMDGMPAGTYYLKVVGYVNAENSSYKLEINPATSDYPDLYAYTPEHWGSPVVVTSQKWSEYDPASYGAGLFKTEKAISSTDEIFLNVAIANTWAQNVSDDITIALYINGERVTDDDMELLGLSTLLSGMTAGDSQIWTDLSFGIIGEPGSLASKYFVSNLTDGSGINTIQLVIDPDNLIQEYDKGNNVCTVEFKIDILEDDQYTPNGSRAEVDNNTNETHNPRLNPLSRTPMVVEGVITGKIDPKTGDYLEDWFSFELQGDDFSNGSAVLEFISDKGMGDVTLGDLDLYIYKLDEASDVLYLVGKSSSRGDKEVVSFDGYEAGTYYARIVGFNGASNQYTLTLVGDDIEAPTKPQTPVVTSVINSNVEIRWEANSGPGDKYIMYYMVQYKRSDSDEWITAYKVDGTSCKFSGLDPDTEYDFRIIAVNRANLNDAENLQNLTPAQQKEFYNKYASDAVSCTTETFQNDVVYRAIIVGVTDYPGTENDLKYAATDAKSIAQSLLNDPQWNEDNILLLTDAQATKYNIQQAFASFASLSDANDVLLFYFAGAGKTAVDQGNISGYLCSYGEKNEDFISSNELAELLSSVVAGQKQVIIDAGQNGFAEYNYGICQYSTFGRDLLASTRNGDQPSGADFRHYRRRRLSVYLQRCGGEQNAVCQIHHGSV